MAKKDILSEGKYVFSQFNPVERDKSKNLYTNTVNPIGAIKDAIRSEYDPDALGGLTRFKAIVLSTELDTSTPGILDVIKSWMTDAELTETIQVRAMIPEIHGAILPTPASLGDENGIGADSPIIDMYPVFTTTKQAWGDSKLDPGNLVWVTFENIANLEGGVLLAPINGNVNLGAPLDNAKGAFDPCKAIGKISSNSKIGTKKATPLPTFQALYVNLKSNIDYGEMLPIGKGLFINDGPDLKKYPVSKAQKAGLNWICVKVTPDHADGNFAPTDEVKSFIKAFHGKNIRVYLFGTPDITTSVEWIQYISELLQFSSKKKEKPFGFIANITNEAFAIADEVSMATLTLAPPDQIQNFSDQCLEIAKQSGTAYGIMSYSAMEGNPIMGRINLFNNAHFVMPKMFFPNPGVSSVQESFYVGLQIYATAGFKNITALGSFFGAGWDDYAGYKSTHKPPEEIIKRTSWFFTEHGQNFLSHKRALGLWDWTAIDTTQVKSWTPESDLWVILRDLEAKMMEQEGTQITKEGDDSLKDIKEEERKEKEQVIAKVEQADKKEPTTTAKEKSKEADIATDPESAKNSEDLRMKATDLAKEITDLTKEKETAIEERDALQSASQASSEEVQQETSATGPTLSLEETNAKIEELEETIKAKKKEMSLAERQFDKLIKVNLDKNCLDRTITKTVGGFRGTFDRKRWATSYDYENTIVKILPAIPANELVKNGTLLRKCSVMNGSFPLQLLPPKWRVSMRSKPNKEGKPTTRQTHKLIKTRLDKLNKAWLYGDKARGIPAPLETHPRVFATPEEGVTQTLFLASGIREHPRTRYTWLLNKASREKTFPADKKGGLAGKPKYPRVIAAHNSGARDLKALFDLYRADRIDPTLQMDTEVAKKQGSKWVAWESPHETGLASDFWVPETYIYDKNGKLTSKTTYITVARTHEPKMRMTEWRAWMYNYAYKFGFTPYKVESWHWNCLITRRAWYTGEDFVKDDNYAVRVEEKSTITGKLTSDGLWNDEDGPAFK